jgi:ubiquinone biosynthesis protein UbiJ
VTDGAPPAAGALPLAALEITLNRLLALDPQALERLGALTGKVVVIELPALGMQAALAPHGGGVQWLSPAPEQVDVRIRGSLADLLRAHGGGNLGDLQIDGDKHLASAFASALRGARIDWPELLTPWMGDLAAQRGAQALASLTGTLRDGADSLLRSGAEFLSYEREALVSANEWDSFRAELRELHDAVGALERRLALLALRLQ